MSRPGSSAPPLGGRLARRSVARGLGRGAPLVLLAACATMLGLSPTLASAASATAPGGADAAAPRASGAALQADAPPPMPQLTPLLVEALSRPVPVRGADGRVHVLYELLLTNATHGPVKLTGIRVRDDKGAIVATLLGAEAAAKLQRLGERTATDTLESAQAGVLFLTLAFASAAEVPARLEHELALDAPSVPGGPAILERAGTIEVDRTRVVPVLGAPLEPGEGYLPADGCCTAVRHIRAALPVDGRLTFAQRFAIDWEQIDARQRFVNGDPRDPASYVIYGKQVIAAGDGPVVSVLDGLPDQVPGALPSGLKLAEVDGNSIVQDIGGGAYALYAHMQPGSIRVLVGRLLRRGDPIGLVGNSGNSSAPHLHFHVMDGPSPLAANGLPYVLDRFRVTGAYPSTEAFDAVENTTEPLPVTPAPAPQERERALPLDLSVVELGR